MALLPLRVAYNKHGPSALLRPGKENAGQTFVKGDVLVREAGNTGQVELAGTDPANIWGIAIADATGVEDSDVPALDPQGGNVFEATVSTEIEAADLTKAYGILRDATAKVWVVDKSDTTNKRVRVVGFRDPVGTVEGRVYVEFLRSFDEQHDDA